MKQALTVLFAFLLSVAPLKDSAQAALAIAEAVPMFDAKLPTDCPISISDMTVTHDAEYTYVLSFQVQNVSPKVIQHLKLQMQASDSRTVYCNGQSFLEDRGIMVDWLCWGQAECAYAGSGRAARIMPGQKVTIKVGSLERPLIFFECIANFPVSIKVVRACFEDRSTYYKAESDSQSQSCEWVG